VVVAEQGLTFLVEAQVLLVILELADICMAPMLGTQIKTVWLLTVVQLVVVLTAHFQVLVVVRAVLQLFHKTNQAVAMQYHLMVDLVFLDTVLEVADILQ
jgi:hypothetical protein